MNKQKKTKNAKNCVGHKNILEEKFPFHHGAIDMEDQGVALNGSKINHLNIYFCPVCGEKL